MRFACADYTFPLVPHEAVLDLLAALNFDALDLGVMGNRSHVRPEAVKTDPVRAGAAIREAANRRGLTIADVFLIPGTDFETLAVNHPEKGKRTESRELYADVVEFAVAAGAPGITLLPGIHWQVETRERSLSRAADELQLRVAAATDVGLRLSVEPHVGSLIPTPRAAWELINRCEGLELTLDPTHFIFAGIDQDEVRPLLKASRHFHARTACVGSLQTTLARNTIDFRAICDAMSEAHYDGYIGLEYLWMPGAEPGSAYDLTNVDTIAETVNLRDYLALRLPGGKATNE